MNDRFWPLIEPVVEGMGFEFWGLEVQGSGSNTLLRVYIDAESGVDVDDCARVSGQISSMLDVEDPISGRYTLEVSSPGVDRRLFKRAQYERFKGSSVQVQLRSPFEGRKRYKGTLCGMEGEDVVLRAGEEEYLFPFGEIDKVRVIPDFEQKG